MDIQQFRSKIDAIDHQLIDLFLQRMNVSKEISEYKKKNGLPTYVPAREQEKINEVVQQAGSEMASYARILYYCLFELGRSYQNKNRPDISEEIAKTDYDTFSEVNCIACMGNRYQNIYKNIFPISDICVCDDPVQVIQMIIQGTCQYGILPGTRQTYALISENHLYITKAICTQTHIQGVHSPDLRFFVIGKEYHYSENADTTSLILHLENTSESLYKLLARLLALDIKVQKLDTWINTDDNSHIQVTIEIQIPVTSPNFAQLIGELREFCSNYQHLGSYVVATQTSEEGKESPQ